MTLTIARTWSSAIALLAAAARRPAGCSSAAAPSAGGTRRRRTALSRCSATRSPSETAIRSSPAHDRPAARSVIDPVVADIAKTAGVRRRPGRGRSRPRPVTFPDGSLGCPTAGHGLHPSRLVDGYHDRGHVPAATVYELYRGTGSTV